MTGTPHPPSRPVLIGIDWGSSNLRAALLDEKGTRLDRRESAEGVFALKNGDFGAALWRLCGDWVAEHRLPMLACGMIGSRQGIVEAPYVSCPADVNDLARHMARAEIHPGAGSADTSTLRLHIVPGLKTGSNETGWDVIRGEETQLFGVPDRPGSLTLLPGTHSKWMTQGVGARIEGFQTYMTGELFELLRSHSSLARVMAPPQWSPDAFQLGVAEARDDTLENLLFRVRTAGLMGRFAASALADYLSGMLIGAEVKAGLRRFNPPDPQQPIRVLGAAPLTQRYAMAMASFGLTACEIPGDAVFDGLMAVARAAGLLPCCQPFDSLSEACP